MSSCSYISITDISSRLPKDGWSLIKKEYNKILYVPKGKIKFIWSSIISAKLYTNYPDSYSNDLKLISSSSYNKHEHIWEACLDINISGNFQLQMKLENGLKSSIDYFLVEPELPDLNLSSIICETVITKLLGPFSRWESILNNIHSLKYNMVHFTPIQCLGKSRSAYSIYDHHMLTNQISNNDNNTLSEEDKEHKLSCLINEFSNKGLYSICDVVWNHTAINTPWIINYPDATYNLSNSPHLRPAYCLDRALQCYNRKLIRRFEVISTNEDVDRIMGEIQRSIIPSLKLWEFFIIDVSSEVLRYEKFIDSNENLPIEHEHHPFASSLTDNCIIHNDGRRGSKKVRMSCIQQIFSSVSNKNDKIIQFKRELERYNLIFYNQWNEDEKIILDSLRNHITYDRVDPNGPKNTIVNDSNPLVLNYFTTLKSVPFINKNTSNNTDNKNNNNIEYDDLNDYDYDDCICDISMDGANNFACANAGWVFGMENTLDLTSSETRIYLRRQLVVWNDSIRLRYGNKPSDSPYLWEYMRKYTCQIARIFHGIRIDNCHSTSIVVAQYLLQAARSIRPNLFVMAELFTEKKNEIKYCEKLGLTCLIREAMHPHSPKDLYSSVYNAFGGSHNEIGSLFSSSIQLAKDPFYKNSRIYLKGQDPRIIYFDCTHDNDPPSIKRTTRDTLPNSTIVASLNCSIGSVYGYDQLVPHKIHVVTEERLYPLEFIGGGIQSCKILLNSLHSVLNQRGYTQFHIKYKDNICMIIRHNPDSLKSVYFLVHSSFYHQINEYQSINNHFTYNGEFVEELFAGIVRTNTQLEFKQDKDFINGIIPTLFWPHQTPIPSTTSILYELYDNKIQFNKFPPGSIIGFSTKLPLETENSKIQLLELSSDLNIQNILKDLSLVDFNKILYSCSAEESLGTYNVPNWGSMTYCGIVGIILCFNSINENNTVNHPLCNNLQEGTWLLDYTLNRLSNYPKLYSWMKHIHQLIKKLYSFLIPKYFHWYLVRLYSNCLDCIYNKMSLFIQNGDSFIKSLALCSIQVYGNVSSAPLRYKCQDNRKISPSLSAGLPHFSAGYMRTWGRDTFISLRGLMLVTGRYSEALDLICAFASCLRHGMIPNLLASGKNSRFNARDATWWFLQSLQDYCEFVYNKDQKKTIEFLNTTKVVRNFPYDDQNKEIIYCENTLCEIIQEIFTKHTKGISYREWNAGNEIDNHMSYEGFNVTVYCDPQTGFIHGGNKYNCGTWMDKMGESIEFGSMGIPSTPRDGADIEIIGLLSSTLRWLSDLCDYGFPNTNYIINNNISLTYSKWYSLLLENFEKQFWVPINGIDDKYYNINLPSIFRRGIYKDTVGASVPAQDYCLRPNQCIAMVVAPELFNKDHASYALEQITKLLLGKLGMKTLDPTHPRYAPYYDTNSTNGYYEAKGFNYHQGPEWVWVIGYYLRARLQFDKSDIHLIDKINDILREHREHIKLSSWAGLPELTNKDGELCKSSCPTQAWSAATILDTLYSMDNI